MPKAERSAADVKLTEYPEQVYFGDTHLHTSNSSDAFGLGVRLGPEEALRFARGEQVTSTTGLKAKLSRPLDFLVIADHSARPGDGITVAKTLHRIEEKTLRAEIETAGFELVAEADFLRNPADPRDTRVFQPQVPVDEFVLKYRKPR